MQKSKLNKGDKNSKEDYSFPQIKIKANVKIDSLIKNEIFLVHKCLSISECHHFIEYAERIGFEHQSSRGSSFQEAYRDNDRIMIYNELLSNMLWKNTGLELLFNNIEFNKRKAIGLNPNIRFYRYSKGQKFGRHIDESSTMQNGLKTLYTLLIYLNGSIQQYDKNINEEKSNIKNNKALIKMKGGETIFYGKKNRIIANIIPIPGSALLHVHGDLCNEHEGAKVLDGIKYVLRSDVIFSDRL